MPQPKLGRKFKLPGKTLKFGQGIGESVGAPPGPQSFLDLTDTPDDYDGQAGKIIQVNLTEENLEFATKPTSNLQSFSYSWGDSQTAISGGTPIITDQGLFKNVYSWKMPKTGKLYTLSASLYGSAGTATTTATLYKNGSSTSLVCSFGAISGSEQNATDTDAGISFSAGDLLTISLGISAGTGNVQTLVANVTGEFD